MKIRADLDRGAWTNQLRKLSEVMGQTMDEAVRGQARLVIRDCIRLTPPFTAKPYKPYTESFKAQLKAGERAVQKSVLRVFRPANAFWVLSTNREGGKDERAKQAATYAKRGDIGGIRKLFFDSKPMQRLIAVERAANPHTYDMTRGRDGRPPRKFGGIMIHKGTVPTWGNRRGKKGVTKYGGIDAIYKDKVAKLGIAKAGWLDAADKLGLPAKDCPAWVRKHKGRASGGSVYRFVEGVKAMVICGNGVPYIQKSGATLRIAQTALKNREQNLYKQISMAIKKKAAKLGVKPSSI